MSDPKSNTGFFRKVVKFVANPATEWSALDTPEKESDDSDFAKVEIKEMIERKRRNDFVRKREFDMLRRLRREGLSGQQLGALEGSSRLDDPDAAALDNRLKPDSGVAAKIDEIEQQMVGRDFVVSRRRPADSDTPPPQKAPLRGPASTTAPANANAPPRSSSDKHPPGPGPAAPPLAAKPTPELAPLQMNLASTTSAEVFGEELAVITHDPELDEAVIAFANADFDLCENSLSRLTATGGARAKDAETWRVRFDFYRATGQQHKFETLALEYARQFGLSAPQWYSLPTRVADSTSQETRPVRSQIDGVVGWVCPAVLDADGVAGLASRTLQMPLPWVFDWSMLERIDAQACSRLSDLFRKWIPQSLDMRWLAGDRLLRVLQEAAPSGVRDADPAYWQLRLDALRMTNRPDQFDDAAIDYCVTYEVSPPSWERASCRVRVSGADANSTAFEHPAISNMSTGFLESQLMEDDNQELIGNVDLSGQLVGDIGATLKKLDSELGGASTINVSCSRLIRVDFLAAGDLLNWVLSRRGENRRVTFIDAHRLVALFFGAMGIDSYAQVAPPPD